MKKLSLIITCLTFLTVGMICACTPPNKNSGSADAYSSIEQSEIIMPEIQLNEITYDKSTAGSLQIPVTLGSALFYGVKIDETPVNKDCVLVKNGFIEISENVLLDLPVGSYFAQIITDYDPLNFKLKIDNFVYDRVEMPQSITYSNEEITIEADLSQTNLKEVLIEGIPVLNKHYEYSQNKIVLKNSLFKILPAVCSLRILLENNNYYQAEVFTNNLYASDFDTVTDWDKIQSDYGWNPLANDTNMISFIDNGIDGRSLRYAPAEGSYKMGSWANLFMTVKDPSYIGSGITWKSIDFLNNNSSVYEISFDYRYEGTGDETFALYLLQDSSDGYYSRPLTSGIAFPIEHSKANANFTLKFTGNALKGFYIHATNQQSKNALLVDNFRVTKLSDAEELISISETYDHCGKEGQSATINAQSIYGKYVAHAFIQTGAFYSKIPASALEKTNTTITLSAEYTKYLTDNCNLILFFNDGQFKKVKVSSDLVLFSDYDNLCLYDSTESEYGANAFAQDSAMISLSEEFDDKALKYQPGKASYAMGKWANRFLTLRNVDKYTFTWYPLIIDSNKTYTISFDYFVSENADCDFKISILNVAGDGAYITPEQCGTVYNLNRNGKQTFTATLKGSDFWGLLIFAPDGYSGNAYLLIDNLKITVN